MKRDDPDYEYITPAMFDALSEGKSTKDGAPPETIVPPRDWQYFTWVSDVPYGDVILDDLHLALTGETMYGRWESLDDHKWSLYVWRCDLADDKKWWRRRRVLLPGEVLF